MTRNNKLKSVLLLIILTVCTIFSVGCSKDEKFVYVQAAGTTTNAVTTQTAKAVSGQATLINTTSFKFELPSNAYPANTEIIVKEDATYSTLGNNFSARFTPQSAVLNFSTIQPSSSGSILQSLLASTRSQNYFQTQAASLVISLLNSNSYDASAKYFLACKDSGGKWSYLNCQYLGAGNFQAYFNTRYQTFVLVKRNSLATPTIVKGLEVKGPSSLVADHSGVYDKNATFTLSLSKNDSSKFDPSDVFISFIAFDKNVTLPFIGKAGERHEFSTQSASEYFATLPLPLSIFSDYTTIGENATYTFVLALAEMDVAMLPQQLMMRVSYDDTDKYVAEKVVSFSKIGVPNIHPTVLSVEPANESVILRAELDKIKVRFKEDMLFSSLAGSLVLNKLDVNDDPYGEDIVCGVTGYDSESLEATFNIPSVSADTKYRATLKNVRNQYDHPLQTPYTWTFRVVEFSGVASVLPANDATNVPINTSIVLTFQKPISDPTEVSFDLGYNGGASIGYNFEWASNKDMVTLTPYTNLNFYSKVDLTLSGGTDIDGYAIDGFNMSFTTVARTERELVRPTNNGGNIPINTQIVMGFTQTVAANTSDYVKIYRKLPAETGFTEDTAVVHMWTNDHKTLTIIPADGANWKYHASYEIRLMAGAVDINGNEILAKTWAFSTLVGDKPTVVSLAPTALTRTTAELELRMTANSGKPLNLSEVKLQVTGDPPNNMASGGLTLFASYTGHSRDAIFKFNLSGLERNKQYWVRVQYKLESDNLVYYNTDDANNFASFITEIWEGQGTEASPYLVSTAQELMDIAQKLDKHFRQTADITLAGDWAPLGATQESPFTGTYDGNEKKITGLALNQANLATEQRKNGIGLFGFTNEAHLKNVRLHGAQITGVGETAKIGALVGRDYKSTITNCHILNANLKGHTEIGGIIGDSEQSTLKNCLVSGAVTIEATNTTTSKIGGMVGKSLNSHIQNSTVVTDGTFSIIGYIHAGGILGHGEGGSISGCQVTEVTMTNSKFDSRVGLVVGLASSNMSISGCGINSSAVKGKNHVGGVVGEGYSVAVSGCTISDCEIRATNENPRVGLIYGEALNGSTHVNCSVTLPTLVNEVAYQNTPAPPLN